MPSCVFRKCANHTAAAKDIKDVSFHSLPADGLMKVKWIEVIRIQRGESTWLPTAYSLVCSNHFRPEDLYSAKNKLRHLKKMAIPVLPYDIKREPNSPEGDSLNDISISDSDLTFYYSSVLNLPIKTHFESEMKKVKAEKRQLQMINSNLFRKNRKLEAKWYKLKSVIADLKKTHKCTQPSQCSAMDNSDFDKEGEQENISIE